MTSVTLNEIFGNASTPYDARFMNMEELPTRRIDRIKVRLPYGQLSEENWVSFNRDLSTDGLEITEMHDRTVYISGYPPRSDYDVQQEVEAMLTKYRCAARSKSFSD